MFFVESRLIKLQLIMRCKSPVLWPNSYSQKELQILNLVQLLLCWLKTNPKLLLLLIMVVHKQHQQLPQKKKLNQFRHNQCLLIQTTSSSKCQTFHQLWKK